MVAIPPLAPVQFTDLPALAGVRLGVAETGIKYKGRADLLFLIFDESVPTAGVFTTSRCPSAPVDHCQGILKTGLARGVVVNAGNANAFTGEKGKIACQATANQAAHILGCTVEEIYLASTGVIGEPLDFEKIVSILPQVSDQAREDNWLQAAHAIMTTDTFVKVATKQINLDGVLIKINAIAKGSGMIAPDMATMLAFIVTDAAISAPLLQDMLQQANETSFNAISVDSDTSTSDTVLLFATRRAAIASGQKMTMIEHKGDPRAGIFAQALQDLLQDLALQIVRDGEGATKLIEVEVCGAMTSNSAKNIARAIINSPLVKTAIAGEDANWGRVIMAIGKAGEEADRDKLAIWFGDIRVAAGGERDVDYREEEVCAYMKNSKICIRVDLQLGEGQARMWGCDLTAAYIEINGSYRS